MNRRDKSFIIGGVIICLVIAVMSPFIASSDPDGLEKSAENVGVGETQNAINVPFPDYEIEGLGKIGDIVALALGVIVTLIIALLVATLIQRRTPPKSSK